MAGAHRHDDLELNLLLDGACEYQVAGRRVTVPRGRLLVLWGAMPHRSVGVSADARLIWVTAPLRQVLAWSPDAGMMDQLLKRGWLLDPIARDTDEPTLRQWINDLGRAGSDTRQVVLLELEARLRRLAMAADGRAQPAKPHDCSAAERNVLRIERLIAERFQEALSVDDIAGAVGLHPNYAMAVFREHTGQTLVQAITTQRIAYAKRRLALTDDSVLDICLDAGFGSTSRFHEAFKREVGCSPRKYRQQLREE